jgi:hypothetical protein
MFQPTTEKSHDGARGSHSPLAGRELRISLIIGLCCLLVYNANRRAISAGDTYPARYLPFAIWHDHTLRLDPIEKLTAQGRGDTAYWVRHVSRDHAISLYPVTLPVLLAPLYLPAVIYLDHRGWTAQRVDEIARIMEKLSASLLAALSAALLYLTLRRRASLQNALLLTLAYALGTTTWGISSQALWQHGMGQLLVIAALLVLTGPCTLMRTIAAGLLCGLIASNRPPDAILALALGGYGLFWARRWAPLLIAAAAVPAGLVLFYNLSVAGHFAGAYGLEGKRAFLQHDLFSGIAGLLFSPVRGLFIFSPFLLFLALIWRYPLRDRSERALSLAIVVGVSLQILLYAKSDWRAGISWGPRYMTDLLPLLIWMLAPVVASLRGLGRASFLLAVGASVAIEAIGAFYYTGETDRALDAASGPDKMRGAWDWHATPFVASLRHGDAPAELTAIVRGSFDGVETRGVAADVVAAGEEVSATGWALANHGTPFQVAVILDGQNTFATRIFTDRPDVVKALGETRPSGWRMAFSTEGLAPGEHHLTALAWANEKGEGHYLADRKLTVLEVRGNIDALAVGGHAVDAAAAGEDVAAEGWALIGDATPFQVAVVIDGQKTFATRTFINRPDIRQKFHESSFAGWGIPLGNLTPGEHRLAAFAWASENGKQVHLADRVLTVRAGLPTAPDLEAAARIAEVRLRAHQQAAGDWLTAYTATAGFEAPQQELDTFVTALLIDVLSALEASGRLGDSLRRAREYLTEQIEATGLVRYHGRPDAPRIGTLGCVITPDTDDTALVWRIAPSSDLQRRATALASIDHYRTPEGLYQTWLAPRQSYQCLDPGNDPNPTDIGIQMHLLMLLAEAQPPASRALCDVLKHVVDQDRLWVYYRKTPLVPMLRLTGLWHAGCELALPESRMRASVPGQEIWVSVLRMLVPQLSGPSLDDVEIAGVLRRLAKDDFALLRKKPPLLFHNDLTATVSRYYWSEDIGYALWLRLYDQFEFLRHRHTAG